MKFQVGIHGHNIVNSFKIIIIFSKQIIFTAFIIWFLAWPSLWHCRDVGLFLNYMNLQLRKLCCLLSPFWEPQFQHTFLCFRLLESEFERHKLAKNMDTAMKLHDVGVTLFYHIITLYNDESAFYPPSKQLLTTCIETLGQVSTVKSRFSVTTFMKSHISLILSSTNQSLV